MPLYFNQRFLHVPSPVVLTSRGEPGRSRLLPPPRLLQGERGALPSAGVSVRARGAASPRRPSTTSASSPRGPGSRRRPVHRHGRGAGARGVYGATFTATSLRQRVLRGARRLRRLASSYAAHLHASLRTLSFSRARDRAAVSRPRRRRNGDDRRRPGTSRGAVYECDVAVALRSSMIWERIDLGLDRSLMYVSAAGSTTSCPSRWVLTAPMCSARSRSSRSGSTVCSRRGDQRRGLTDRTTRRRATPGTAAPLPPRSVPKAPPDTV